MNSIYKMVYRPTDFINFDLLEKVCIKHPDDIILLEFPNTAGLSSRDIKSLPTNTAIRISGPYDNTKLDSYEGKSTEGMPARTCYFLAVVYPRNEMIKIMEALEKIEAGINENWSTLQKVIYIYDKLNTEIIYDPRYRKRKISDTSSLRGLLSKKTVCAGYSLIFKELLERQNIKCEYISGKNHAWNIVTIGTHSYHADLTWDNGEFRAGKYSSFKYLGPDVSKDKELQKLYEYGNIQARLEDLSSLDQNLINIIASQMNRTRDYRKTIYSGIRSDGSEYIVIQTGDKKVGPDTYYRYYYFDRHSREKPLILYSETNLTRLVENKKFSLAVPDGYEEIIDNVLFSYENISDSLSNGSCYLGKITSSESATASYLTTNPTIEKSRVKMSSLKYPIRRFTRSDGSTIIIQRMNEDKIGVADSSIIQYDTFELLADTEMYLKGNALFTEQDLFKIPTVLLDNILSREHIDKSAKERGGYLGHFDEYGNITYNSNLTSYFDINKSLSFPENTKH